MNVTVCSVLILHVFILRLKLINATDKMGNAFFTNALIASNRYRIITAKLNWPQHPVSTSSIHNWYSIEPNGTLEMCEYGFCLNVIRFIALFLTRSINNPWRWQLRIQRWLLNESSPSCRNEISDSIS